MEALRNKIRVKKKNTYVYMCIQILEELSHGT